MMERMRPWGSGCRVKGPKPYLSKRIEDAVFAFVDTETTGLWLFDRGPNRVVEIACALCDASGRVLEKSSTFVNPGRTIPEEATMVHGIRDEDVRDAPEFVDALEECFALVERADMLWGYNSPFDLRFVLHELNLADIDAPDIDFYDVARLAARAGFGKCSLSALAADLRVPAETEHRALADAITTGKALGQLLQGKLGAVSTLDELVRLHDQTAPVYSTQRCLEGVLRAHEKEGDWRTPRVCLTGALPGIPRREVKPRLDAAGFKYTSEVTETISFVVLGERPTPRKVEDAERLRVETMSGVEFLRWLVALESIKAQEPGR